MTTEELYKRFIINNTKGLDGIHPNAAYFRKYGNISFEEAFEIYLEEINVYLGYKEKIKQFEAFLLSNGYECEQSNISESRYYFYKGIKYRFSNHIYPTGSMTNELLNVIDLAANPELIMKVKY